MRTDTLDWPLGTTANLSRNADRWASAQTHVVGNQIDFDARTKGLGDYAAFLERVRQDLPLRYQLSTTGLMDWSANRDPAALARLKLFDEVVI